MESRIDNYKGSDSEYIVYLESKVRQLLVRQPFKSPLPSPSSTDHPAKGKPNNAIQFISCSPSTSFLTSPPAKRKRESPRWQKGIDEMLSLVPITGDWSSLRESVGLSSFNDILYAYDMIIDGSVTHVVHPEDQSLPGHEYSDPMLRLASNYAEKTRALELESKLMPQIVYFRQLVFASWCVVMVYNGYDETLVDKMMRQKFGSFQEKHLKRLRGAALWVNRVICELSKNIGHRATELFVLCGQSISKYGRFRDCGELAHSYLIGAIPTWEQVHTEPTWEQAHTEIQSSLPFSIPLFVMILSKDYSSLPQICTALGYDCDDISNQHSYLETYRSRGVPLPEISGQPTNSMEESPRVNSPSCDVNTAVEVLPGSLDSLEALLAAAKQSDLSELLSIQEQGDSTIANTSLQNNHEIYDSGFGLIAEQLSQPALFNVGWDPLSPGGEVAMFGMGWDPLESNFEWNATFPNSGDRFAVDASNV